MICNIRESNGKALIEVHGDLDNAHAANNFRETMYEVLTSGKKEAIIDMNAVESINSHGIGKLLLFYNKFKDIGGDLRITSTHGNIKEIFETLRMDVLFKVEKN
ncbi:MAG: STAS domain-containing protein [Nitrospirae bacterium]|nr:STAS domain-containing protein [Nitrospirota bacterium]